MTNEFTVWIFFPDGTHIPEGEWLEAEEAARLAHDVTRRPAAKVGIISRVIITDGGDFTCFEWIHGKGVTFPPRGQDGKFTA